MRNTFDYFDGDIYLEHHGILGQKWGVRRYQNKDGTLTDEGKKRYRQINNSSVTQTKIYNVFEKIKYNEDPSDSVFSALHADKKYLKEAYDIIQKNTDTQKEITKETDKLFADLRSDENLHVYEAASELADCADYYGNGNIDNCTLDTLSQAGYMGVLEDGQQSYINAYSMYALKYGLQDKVDDLYNRSYESYKNTRAMATDVINQGLAEVGADELKAYSRNGNYRVGPALVDHIMNSNKYGKWEDTSGSFYLNDASWASKATEQDKQNISKAENYVRKINKANDANTWWYIGEAAENLGMSSTKLSNMSQSDWDRINAEIRKLREKG